MEYDQIPLIVRQAFIAAEDDRFFEHHGFDWQGMMRALFVNLTSRGQRQGGSTITMQTARSAFLTQEQTTAAQAAGDLRHASGSSANSPSRKSSRSTST